MNGTSLKSKSIVIPSWQAYEPWATKQDLIWLQELAKGNQKVIHAELLRCQKNPWHFLRAWCLTENVHSKDQSNPYESFPDKPHLFYLTKMFEVMDSLLIAKARQMTVTWLFGGLALHHCMFHPARMAFWQSKKEDDSNGTLERIYIMYQKLPDFMKLWQPCKQTYCLLKFPRIRSQLRAIPQGADQVRQFTPSLVISDETAFQEEVDKMMAAIAPTKPKFVGISSAAPSYFQRLVLDQT